MVEIVANRAQQGRRCLLKIAYGLRPLMFGASLDTLRADDFRPGLAVPVAPKLSSVARRTAARGTRLAAPASGAESVATATVAARDGGPVALGVAVAIVDLSVAKI